MVIYEVNINIDKNSQSEFMPWLKEHVQAMLQQDGFLNAAIFHSNQQEPHCINLTIQYQLIDQAALDHYFQYNASRMQAEGIQRFGDVMQATRRVLTPVADLSDI